MFKKQESEKLLTIRREMQSFLNDADELERVESFSCLSEFEKAKNHSVQKKLKEKLKNEAKNKEYDYSKIDVAKIREDVAKNTAARDYVNAESFLAKR